MIPRYTFGAAKAISVLLRYRNDIDIYTEDKISDKEFYKYLLLKLTDGAVKINDVFPLGPKSQVIKQCSEDTDTTRKKLYIVDGDLELINNSNASMNNLYILDMYCIENGLIEEAASIEVIWYFTDGLSKEVISNKLNYTKWLKSLKITLIDLFLHFSILR